MTVISARIGGDVVVRKTTDSSASGLGLSRVLKGVRSSQVGAPEVAYKMFRGRIRPRQIGPQLWPRGGH